MLYLTVVCIEFLYTTNDSPCCGFYSKGFKLILHNKTQLDLNEKTELRLAHIYDIYKSGNLSYWQAHLFENKIKQPFKQVFRELYFINSDEKSEPWLTRRYGGNQIQVRQSLALFRARHWFANEEDGISKIYREYGLIAEVYFVGDLFTPGDIEGATVEAVRFFDRQDYSNVKLTDVHPLAFSECMRDLDLVVSVAHSGKVDPESSLSTIEMRKALVRETARLLGINNLTEKGNFIYIKGELRDYSIHMGSGTVHWIPGGMMNIIAIHAAHRGRIFLPFVDNDPKTAEIISKMILFAQDKKIKR